tara:strand:- start:25 stop:300 length:276 start_codon:yes stop_codon:yes gene_type:complete
LDADAEGADWREVARIVLHRDPMAEPGCIRHCWKADRDWCKPVFVAAMYARMRFRLLPMRYLSRGADRETAALQRPFLLILFQNIGCGGRI